MKIFFNKITRKKKGENDINRINALCDELNVEFTKVLSFNPEIYYAGNNTKEGAEYYKVYMKNSPGISKYKLKSLKFNFLDFPT